MLPKTSGGAFQNGQVLGGLGLASDAKKGGARVVQLTGDDRPGDRQTSLGTIRATKLLATKQHVPGDAAIDASDQPTGFGEEGYRHAFLAAKLDDPRRDVPRAEEDDGIEHVNRQSPQFFLVGLDDDVEMIATKNRSRREDVKCVELNVHGPAFSRL